ENLVYGKILAPFARGERRLFPGFIAIGLALVGLSRRDRVVLAYALGLIVAVDVSLGYNGFTYRLLYNVFLPFRGLRIPARSGIVAGFSLALLAGFGAARIVPRDAVAALGALMCVEYLSHNIAMMTVPVPPPQAYAGVLRDNAGDPPATLF